jgi:hypothetical protein
MRAARPAPQGPLVAPPLPFFPLQGSQQPGDRAADRRAPTGPGSVLAGVAPLAQSLRSNGKCDTLGLLYGVSPPAHWWGGSLLQCMRREGLRQRRLSF